MIRNYGDEVLLSIRLEKPPKTSPKSISATYPKIVNELYPRDNSILVKIGYRRKGGLDVLGKGSQLSWRCRLTDSDPRQQVLRVYLTSFPAEGQNAIFFRNWNS
ncbi:hypothetical protein CEXT_767661 [Caerostris extrusa]|uniref:Uncharacterized protein n=1 Tax=Caerostris extrusa TaxID=172846 RepID=A0AAV4UCS2_CAEEX|nr:hypothetical protein CEXT_767661 [Caerostris extrusa]